MRCEYEYFFITLRSEKRKADKFRFYSRMSLKRMLLGDRYEI